MTNAPFSTVEFPKDAKADYDEEICKSLKHLIDMILELMLTKNPNGSKSSTDVIDILKRFYEFMVKYMKYLLKVATAKRNVRVSDIPLPESVIDLVIYCGNKLHGQDFLDFMEATDTPNKVRPSKKRDLKAVQKVERKGCKTTSLVFAKENYDNYLVKLASKYNVSITA